MFKILPFEKNAYFSVYQYDAFSFGILQANPKTYPWIYSNFIQYELNSGDVWLQQRQAILKTHIFDSNTIMSPRVIMEEIKQSILNEHYVAGLYDEFYIPQKFEYKKNHFLHDFLLYGFDDQTQEFFSYGYIKGEGNYHICKEFSIKYSDFIKSILLAQYNDCWTESLYRVKINENLNCNFDRMRLCDELFQYLKQPVLIINEPINSPCGICVWKDLYDSIKNATKETFGSVPFLVKIVNEHVQLMLDRLNYINDNEIEIKSIVKRYTEFAKKSNTNYAMSLKFLLTDNNLILKRLMNNINSMFVEEYTILRELLNVYIENHMQIVLQQ